MNKGKRVTTVSGLKLLTLHWMHVVTYKGNSRPTGWVRSMQPLFEGTHSHRLNKFTRCLSQGYPLRHLHTANRLGQMRIRYIKYFCGTAGQCAQTSTRKSSNFWMMKRPGVRNLANMKSRRHRFSLAMRRFRQGSAHTDHNTGYWGPCWQ